MDSLESKIKAKAKAIGFDLVGIAPAMPADGFARLHNWLERGFAGEMDYMPRQAEARRHPSSILPEVRSVVMTALNYFPETEPPCPAGSGRVARYARGHDYHEVLRDRLQQLLGWLQNEVPGCRGRAVVDTAPLLERDFARRAGLGWFGKDTMLINKRLGSYFFIGALLADIELQSDSVHESKHCGTCTACLDLCPTEAFTEPGVLDSRLCISYLTIELRNPIPTELRAPIGDWLFGCDICQEVCPWNRKVPMTTDTAFAHPDMASLNLIELLGMSDSDFRQRFRHTALWRGKRPGLLRNAAIVLGNQRCQEALPALRRLLDDLEPLIREAAAWAVSTINEP